jgi:YVTN family beta-propeller protein
MALFLRASRPWACYGLLAALLAGPRESRAEDFANFESAHVHPLALSADGRELYAVNTPDGRLAIFRVAEDGSLAFDTDLPVGVDPVSLAVRDGRIWVVNHISDSISVVDAASRRIVDTLRVGDEPTDVVFANGRAFVSLAGGRDQVKVFDATSRAEIGQMDIFGDDPRALAASADGSEVYLVVLESGNRTTAIPAARVTAGGGPPAPIPARSAQLSAPPRTALIARFNPANRQWEDETGKSWADEDEIDVPDEDLFVIDTDTLEVSRRVVGVGTTLFDVAVQPGSGRLWVANTDARNAVRFEPNLRGHFVDTRLSVIEPSTGDVTHVDLNPHVRYEVTPGPASEIERSAAIPVGLSFTADGSTCFVAAFGSSRVAVVDTATATVDGIRVGGGPSGLALAEATGRLYVLNRFDHSVSVVDVAAKREVQVLGLAGPGGFDPSPEAIRRGRRFLYDASATSGHGDQACASCHVFGNFDGLAWDLGDPTGSILPYSATDWLVFSGGSPLRSFFHPMKGPMVTQTLRGLQGLEPFHWRGDKRDFQSFNGAFVSLLGRQKPLSTADMDAFTDFIMTVRMPPNPFRTLDDGLPETIAVPRLGGRGEYIDADPRSGENVYFQGVNEKGDRNCVGCHPLPNGTDNTLNSSALESQDAKISQLRNIYEKVGFQRLLFDTRENLGPPRQKSGFGVLHAGAVSLTEFLMVYFLQDSVKMQHDMAAFSMAFPSGTPPVVGRQLTVHRDDARTLSSDAEIALMMDQAALGNCDLVVRGVLSGEEAGFLYDADRDFLIPASRASTPVGDATLRSSLAEDDVLTYTAVPAGSGRRLGLDRDRDSWFDGDETAAGSSPADPDSTPVACDLRDAGSLEGASFKLARKSSGATLTMRGAVFLGGHQPPTVDVAAHGLIVSVHDADGDPVLHRRVPPGSWQSRAGAKWRFRDRSGTKARGIDRVDVRASAGRFDVRLRGRNLATNAKPPVLPLTAIVVFGSAEQETLGQCGRVELDALRCRLSTSAILCR